MFDLDRICRALNAEGAEAVADYRDKLLANARNEAIYQDLIWEGIAALNLLWAGFRVRMRESHDLEVASDSSMLYMEVKHSGGRHRTRLMSAFLAKPSKQVAS